MHLASKEVEETVNPTPALVCKRENINNCKVASAYLRSFS